MRQWRAHGPGALLESGRLSGGRPGVTSHGLSRPGQPAAAALPTKLPQKPPRLRQARACRESPQARPTGARNLDSELRRRRPPGLGPGSMTRPGGLTDSVTCTVQPGSHISNSPPWPGSVTRDPLKRDPPKRSMSQAFPVSKKIGKREPRREGGRDGASEQAMCCVGPRHLSRQQRWAALLTGSRNARRRRPVSGRARHRGGVVDWNHNLPW